MREHPLHWGLRGAGRCVFALLAFAFAHSVCAADVSKPWEGKRVAILGDSYSTFNAGADTPATSPIGGIYYPDAVKAPDMGTIDNMWFSRAIADLGGMIATNCSWGSSCIITNRYKAKTSEYIHSFEHRARDLPKIDFKTGKPMAGATNGGFNGLKNCNPDVVIVMGGLNDEWQGSIETSPTTSVEVTPTLLKARAKQLFKTIRTELCPNAKELYFIILNDSRNATGFSTTKGNREALIAAVGESAGWTLVDLNYAQMAKSDINSDSHIIKSGHQKYADCLADTVRGIAGSRSALWTGGDGTWTTGSNWDIGKQPPGNHAIRFPENKTLKVTVSGSNLSKNALGSSLTIGSGTSVLFTETATSGYIENWFNTLQPNQGYTFLEEGASVTLEKPKTNAKDNEIYLDGSNILFRSGTTLKTTKGAKFKVTGATFKDPATQEPSDDVTLIADGGATSVYFATGPLSTTLESDNFTVQAINDGTVSYTKGVWIYFNKPGKRTTQACTGGGTIFAPYFQISNGAVATLESSGANGGEGSTAQYGSLRDLGAGSSITVKDGAGMMVGYEFILGKYAMTLNMSGASPLVEVTKGSGEVNLSGGLTWKLRPLPDWSATDGRLDVSGSSSKLVVGSDVKYEIDVSDLVPLTAAKTLCLVASTNKASTAKRTLNLPTEGNVTLTGTNAGDYKATFTKDTNRMYVTIEPKPVDPSDPFAPGDVGGADAYRYAKEGVTYQVIRFTDTAAVQSWMVPAGVTAVDVLAVGGGGAGGAAKYNAAYCGAGGGGAGAFIYKEMLAVAPGQVFTVKVGAGGLASTTATPGDGEASVVVNETANISLTAAGGGHGGGCVVGAAQGGNGGCGGGGYGAKTLGGDPVGNGRGTIGGTGAKVFKSDGTTVRGILGGGGGGAGFAGPSARSYDGCSGGDGLFCRITGESVCYGGGGGGGAAQANNGNTGNGGAGGGGKGGDEGVGVAGTDGLGGGGGGGSSKGSSSTTVFAGGNGGSGVVVIRYVVDMGTAAVPSNLSPNGTMVSVHNAKQKEFLAMSESELRSKFADSSWRGTISKQGDCLPLPVTFSWTGGGYNTVKVYNADGSLFLEKAVRGNSTELWGFDIGTNYTWEVVNSVKGASARTAFTTELEVPRMFRDPNFDEVTFDGSSTCTRKLTGVINMRELGGYVGLEGRRIRTGRLIRTARITENSLYSRDPGRIIGDSFVKTDAARAFWLDTLGIRTQVDLRDPDEYGSDYIGNEVGVFGSSVRWVKFTTDNDEQAIPCYDRIFTEHGKANYKLLLDEMLNPANHPIVFHCSAGKDRTGTLAYILEAILGVSDEDKFRDWVALVLSSTDTQFSPTGAYDPLVAGFGAYEGETQNDKVVSFVKSLGVTDEQIETFRTVMLEGYGEPDVPPEEPTEKHPYTVTWTGAAGDGLWATAGNWDKERTDVDTVRFADDATAIVATSTPGAALTVESGKTVTIKGTAGVTANFTGATAEYQALADGATLIADGGDGFRLTSDAGFRFGSDTTYRVLNGCYSKLSGLRVGDSKNVRLETDGGHVKIESFGMTSGGDIVCRAEGTSGWFEFGGATFGAGELTIEAENGATNTISDLQDDDAVVALSVGTNAVFRISSGENHLFHLGATAGSSLDFHGSSPKVQLSYCNSVKLGANLTVRLTPEAGWNDWTLIQKKSDTSTEGTCTIDAGIHYVIDTRALKGVKDEFSFYLYKNGSTKDTHAIAVPAAGNVTLVGPCADGFEVTFSKPDNYKLMITLTPKKALQPTAKPTVVTDLAYTGSEQTGVASGANYVLEGDASGTDARAYAVTATPKEGYCWDDGSVDSIDLEWSIAQAENDWTTLPTVTPDSFEEGSAGEVDLDVGESRFGEPQADLSAEQIAALTAGTHVITVTVPATGNWKGLETTVSVTVTAADPSVWFDGAVGGEARGGSWTTPLPDRVELTDARYVLAGPDEPFAFTATEAKAADVRTNLIVRTVLRFSEPATDGFPEVQPDQKMAATVCTFGGEARYCVLARDSEASPATNRWVDTGLAATTDKDVALVVTIVKNAQGVTTAEYGFDGETYGPVEVVAEGEISRFSYSGTGEVAALAGRWNELAPIIGPTVDGEPVDPAEVFAMARSNKPIEYPSAPELTGEVGAQTIVFGGVSVSVPRHYTATLSGNTVTLALNDFARPVLEDSDDDKKAIAVGETTVTLHIESLVDGLFYRVVTTATLGGEWTPVTEFLPVADFTVDRVKTDTAAFYKIEVSDCK